MQSFALFLLTVLFMQQGGETQPPPPSNQTRFRLGVHFSLDANLDELFSLGIRLFSSKTDEWGQPDAKENQKILELLAQQRNRVLSRGGEWALSVFTTFPSFEELSRVGEGTVNVQDGKRIYAWSPWDMERIRWSANRYGTVLRRVGSPNTLTVGIFGEYGDASFFTGLALKDSAQRMEWKSRFGDDPPAPGLWSGDSKAKESWQKRLVNLYGSVENAKKEWGIESEGLPIPITTNYPYSARLQYMEWYREAIPYLSSRLAGIVSEIFLNTPILIPVGPPNSQPYLGLDAYLFVRALDGKVNGIKITNVGFYEFAQNWVLSLAKLRGATLATEMPVWTEASTFEQKEDLPRRLFESLALGAQTHVDFPQAYFAHRELLNRLSADLFVRKPVCHVAVLEPTSSHLLRPSQIIPPLLYRSAVELRDYMDFDILEESAVQQGVLNRYRYAVLFEGPIWNSKTLDAIRAWVLEGGILIAYDFGAMRDVNGDSSVYSELFGYAKDLTPVKGSELWIGEIPKSYKVTLGTTLDDELLLGGWSTTTPEGRVAYDAAMLRLPLHPNSESFLEIQLKEQQKPLENVQIWAENKLLAVVSLSSGNARLQFPLDSELTSRGTIRLQFKAIGKEGIRIESIRVYETNAETSESKPLRGWFDEPVEIFQVKNWVRQHGKGFTVFFPAKQDRWKAYLNVIRHLVYRVDQVIAGKTPEKPWDDQKDGIFTTDLGSALLQWNANKKELELKKFRSSELSPPQIRQ